ncbi:MAG: ABC transporter ATP-binding protein, partial [Pseudonocardiaceae bacterium]
PSGSGKSTLLRLLNRLSDPDAGTVRFRGEDVRLLDPLELRRRAVLVPQLPAPLPGTVAENVRYGPGLMGREVDPLALLEMAGLNEGFAERDAGRLSVGEQQRMMFARALALEPEVLLLDEPSAALDPRQRERLWEFILRLAGEGTAVIYATHHIQEADRYASQLIVLADGERVFGGSPRDLEHATGTTGLDFEQAFVEFLHQRGH